MAPCKKCKKSGLGRHFLQAQTVRSLQEVGPELVVGNGLREATMRQVYALIHEAEGSFGISFPDFPGCVAAGSSLDEALERGRAALAFHVATMIKEGEPMPLLRSHAELKADPTFLEDAEGEIRVRLVSVDLANH